MRSIRLLVLYLGLIITLTSCFRIVITTIQKKTNLNYHIPQGSIIADDTIVYGLFDLIEEKDVIEWGNEPKIPKTDGVREYNILLVHGFTTKKATHFDYMVDQIAGSLGLKRVFLKEKIESGRKTSNASARMMGFDPWELYKWVFEKQDDRKSRINFYYVHWSPVTAPVKDFIKAYDESNHRTQLAKFAKNTYLIDVFGDLALYLNAGFKNQIDSSLYSAFDHIGSDPTAVIAGGFGSHLLGSALSQRSKAGHATPNIRKIFLISNQLPFTTLLDLDPNSSRNDIILKDNVYSDFGDYLAATNRELSIVSFYDPNDPFGFRLPSTTDNRITINNLEIHTSEFWRIDPIKTTEFVLPRIKEPEAQALFLNMIDQQNSTQDILLDIAGPANKARNNPRIIEVIAKGSGGEEEKITNRPPKEIKPRDLSKKSRELGIVKLGTRRGLEKLEKISARIDITNAILPFGLPSQFLDTDIDTMMSPVFNGIHQTIREKDTTMIMTIHGMRNQDPDHFDGLIGELLKELGFYPTPVTDNLQFLSLQKKPDSVYGPSSLRIREFTNVNKKVVQVYMVYWSSVTKPVKNWLDSIGTYDNTSKISKLLKQELITDGFGDVILTFNKFQDTVSLSIDAAFESMKINLDNNVYLISGSLGSKILLDHILKDASNNSKKVLEHTNKWFMLTNQIAFTELKDVRLKNDSISYKTFYKEAYRYPGPPLKELNKIARGLEIIAFNDPNDILSFIIPDTLMGVDSLILRNLYLNLATGRQVNMNELIKYGYKIDKRLKKRFASNVLLRKRKATVEINASKKILSTVDTLSEQQRDSIAAVIDSLDYYRSQIKPTVDRAKTSFARKSCRKSEKFELRLTMLEGELARLEGKDQSKSRVKRKIANKNGKIDRILTKMLEWELTCPPSYDLFAQEYKRFVNKRRQCNKEDGIIGKWKCKRSYISASQFAKLYEQGFIMPFLRVIADQNAYQHHVVDFATAHVGPKKSKQIIKMMAYGNDPELVPRTSVDQDLYNGAHKKGHFIKNKN